VSSGLLALRQNIQRVAWQQSLSLIVFDLLESDKIAFGADPFALLMVGTLELFHGGFTARAFHGPITVSW
jgi:hypothetical protein